MKRIVLLFAAACSMFAATWDKDYGAFKVVTFQFTSGSGTNLPGVPVVAGPLVWHTTMFISVSDPTITAIRVRVNTPQSGRRAASEETQVADVVSGYAAVSFAVKMDDIVDPPQVTPLRDGATVRLQ